MTPPVPVNSHNLAANNQNRSFHIIQVSFGSQNTYLHVLACVSAIISGPFALLELFPMPVIISWAYVTNNPKEVMACFLRCILYGYCGWPEPWGLLATVVTTHVHRIEANQPVDFKSARSIRHDTRISTEFIISRVNNRS